MFKSFSEFSDDFYDNHEVSFEAVVKVDGEVIGSVQAFDTNELCTQSNKLDTAMEEHLRDEYAYLVDESNQADDDV